MNPTEVVHKPVTFEIHPDQNGKPYLKKVERRRNIQEEGRGRWVRIGKVTDTGIDRVVGLNRRNGLIVLLDDSGEYRALVLTD